MKTGGIPLEDPPAKATSAADAGVRDARLGSRPLRVGFISPVNPADPTQMSGMVHSAWCALSKRNIELVVLSCDPAAANAQSAGHDDRAVIPPLVRRRERSWVKNAVPAHWRAQIRSFRRELYGGRWTPFEYRRQIRLAQQKSKSIARQAQSHELDVLFGVCMSTLLYALDTDLPIVYCSDATARLVNTTYPSFMKRSDGYKRACDDLESAGLARVWCGLFPSRRTIASAIVDHGLSIARAGLIHFGTTVRPDDGEVIDPDPPSRENLQLVIAAADPVRKRLDFCVEITERLGARGWNVELVSIGPPTRRAGRSRRVRCLGWLSLADAKDRALHRQALRDSHLMLLPSVGEMYGMAPGEAAHFGRPSVVAGVGGLPTAVEDGVSGIVLPARATAQEYVDAIELICDNPESYRVMSRGAMQRAQQLLTWEAWAAAIEPHLRQAAQSGGRHLPRFADGTSAREVMVGDAAFESQTETMHA